MKTIPATLKAAEQGVKTKPVYAYRIQHGTDAAIYLVGYDSNVTISGMPASKGTNPQIFTSAQIAHRSPEQTMALSSKQATVSLAATDAVIRTYFASTPTKRISVEIYRLNTKSLPTSVAWANDVYTELVGIGGAVGFTDYTISLSVAPAVLQPDAKVARFAYTKLCNHVLYSAACGVSPEAAANKLTTTISALNRQSRELDITNTTINGVTITAQTFQWGELKLSDGTRVAIIATSLLSPGVRLRLQWWPLSMTVGNSISVYRGCRRTREACLNDFNNLPAFGGFPTVPTANPFWEGVKNE